MADGVEWLGASSLSPAKHPGDELKLGVSAWEIDTSRPISSGHPAAAVNAMATERDAAVAAIQEIDGEWLVQTAAHAETHGRGRPADAYGALVEVARKARAYTKGSPIDRGPQTRALYAALDALPHGILDPEPTRDA